MPDPILVPATLPPTPLVLADARFLVELVAVEAEVKALSVADQATAQQAADLLRKLTSAGNALEKTRTDLKKPFLDVGRKIDSVAQVVSSRIAQSKARLSRELGDYNVREQRRIAEEQRRRAEELAELQRKRDEEEAAERARLDALSRAAAPVGVEDLSFDFNDPAPADVQKTNIQRQIEALTVAPAPVAQKPAGIRFVSTLKFSVVNVQALPDAFKIVVPNERLIRETYCVGYKDDMPLPVVPGISFQVERSAASSGRGA